MGKKLKKTAAYIPNAFGGYNKYEWVDDDSDYLITRKNNYGYITYNLKGIKVAESVSAGPKGYVIFDPNGNKIGKSVRLWGGKVYANSDIKGKNLGTSVINDSKGFTVYDKKRNVIGESKFGKLNRTYSVSETDLNENCYVATCVYGSYDCPQVWTLRRYRDDFLKKSLCGNIFVKIYYRISPVFVKRFGNTKVFKVIWRKMLDKKVSALKLKGYSDAPYYDN